MKSTQIYQLILTIQECLDEIMAIVDNANQSNLNPNLKINSDLIDRSDHDLNHNHDHDHDQDQDQDQKKKLSGTYEKFILLCRQYDYDYSRIDFQSQYRSIDWIVNNFGSIRDPNKYLHKCFDGAKKSRIGFEIESNSLVNRVANQIFDRIEETNEDVYGVPNAEIMEKQNRLTQAIYEEVKEGIKHYQDIIPTWDKVKDNSIKRKIVTAEAIKRGLL